ncbi:hypothetical protein RND81_05G156400 [Saponaria officinalis]|uniref:VOC domain-containing protein n=1 Tax=Saponaria officinalis TaxID=3572 RepID=A0AAW1KW72_SAPOF
MLSGHTLEKSIYYIDLYQNTGISTHSYLKKALSPRQSEHLNSKESWSDKEWRQQKGVSLNHIARESSDVKRLASFYQQILGFEKIDSPIFGDFEVIWLKLPSSSLTLHLIQRNPSINLPESPYSAVSPVKDPINLRRGHHVSFSVTNFDEFVQSLKEKGIDTFVKTQPDGKTKQVFFFDPDGNGLEVGSW